MKPGHSGIKRLIKATGFSIQGLKAAFKHESAIRQELFMILILGPVALLSNTTPVEKSLLLMTIFLILIIELINSAIEAVVDRIGPELHELSGRAKDIGSAAVLIALILAILVWCIIFFL